MIPTLIALFFVAFITYLWSIKGFFSAFLHMLVIIVAGAIAFALWEPIAYAILGTSNRGFVADSVWGLSLAVPFGIVALVIRLSVDKMIPHNAQAGTAMDYVGGFVCGLVAATISVGIMVISLQYLRMPANSWATYSAIDYSDQGTARGSLEKNKDFLRPYVDEITAKFYSHLSQGTLSTATPMAEYQPDLHLVSTGMRMNFSENDKLGQSRNTVAPQDFDLIGTYTVGPASGAPTNTITLDSQQPGVPQGYVDLNGENISRGYIAGYVITFKAGAKESSGQIVMGNGQITLVAESADGTDFKTLFPLALISQADSTSSDLGRWRYSSKDQFVSSVGGASQATFAFEFLVPGGYTPKHLYVRNVRTDIDSAPSGQFNSTNQRDRSISSGAILQTPSGGAPGGDIDRSESVTIDASDERSSGIGVRNQLGAAIQRGNHGSLNIAEAGKGWWIVDGENVFSATEANTRITEQSLRIDSLAVTNDTVLVKIDVSNGMPAAMTGRAFATADPSQPPIVVDNLGQYIQAVGWTYKDRQRFHVRYTPGRPMESITEAPAISVSRGDQTMQLLFRCNYGTELESFMIGDKEILRFDPPLSTSKPEAGPTLADSRVLDPVQGRKDRKARLLRQQGASDVRRPHRDPLTGAPAPTSARRVIRKRTTPRARR